MHEPVFKEWKRFILLLGMTCVIIMVQGCNLLPREDADEPVSLLPPPEEKLKVVEVKRGYIVEEMKKMCLAEAIREKFLYFTEEGCIKEILVQEEEWVEKGQVLARLETGELEYQNKVAELDLKAAKIRLSQTKAETELGVYSEQALRFEEIEFEKARVNSERFKERLEGSVIKAPYSGKIRTILAKDGEQIEEYQQILKITDPAETRLIVEVTQEELEEVQPGLKLRMEIDDRRWLNGKITRVPSVRDKLQDGSADLRLFIEMEPTNHRFEHMSIFPVIINLREAKDTLILEQSAVRKYFDRTYVRLVEGETVKEVDVEIGIEGSTHVEILKGLKEGDKVIPK